MKCRQERKVAFAKKAGRTKDRRKLKCALLSWWAISDWSANFSLRSRSSWRDGPKT